MHRHFMILIGVILLITSGCNSGNEPSDGDVENSPITNEEVNRYQLAMTGGLEIDHAGGLICKVEEGSLLMEFSIDAYSGPIGYSASFAGFDPASSTQEGVFVFADSPGSSDGPINITFSYGDPPEGYPGVVRAAGTITGSISGEAGAADLVGSYACFLQHGEVGL